MNADISWIIEADGESRFRKLADGSVETQERRTIVCKGCRAAVRTWPGEQARHWAMVEHRPGCHYADRVL